MIDDATRGREAAIWPERDPAWRRLAETASILLHSAHQDGFHRIMPIDESPARPDPVARHRAMDALLDMRDLATDWLSTAPAALATSHVAELTEPKPLKDVLAGCHDEFDVHGDLQRILADQATGLELALSGRVLPCAVAAVASARAHAILLATAGEAEVAADSMVPAVDLLYQARVLRSLSATGTTPIHPYLVWVLARALELCSLVTTDSTRELLDELEKLQQLTMGATEQLLAQDVLHGRQSATGVALACCAATLSLPTAPDPRYVDAALSSAAAAQQGTGLWAEGRQITGHLDPDTGRPTVLGSHDVALAMIQALSWKLVAIPDAEAAPTIIHAIERSLEHAAATQVALPDGNAGWAADATYGRPIVETDATSAVLRLVVTTRRVAESESAARALKGFDLVWHPNRDPTPPYLVWDTYMTDNEPDHQNEILPSLHEWFVKPIVEHRRVDRRPWSPARGRSLLLFGPPGTTKTTIVKAMAEGLGWPLVTLSPGTFIRDGLEHVERRAIDVFKLLERLTATVVLFDECDELFRSREHASDNDNDQLRSISAFMTASMLPKLQDLRDRERIIFVIATNYFDQIDPAAKRIGRIDHIVGVGWPDARQREHMIRSRLEKSKPFNDLQPAIRNEAIKQLAAKTRYCIRGDIVQLASKLEQQAGDLTAKPIVEPLVEGLVRTATKINQKHLDRFKADAAASSETHRSGVGELE